MNMRLQLASAFGLIFIAGATAPVFAAKMDESSTKCSIATLEGSYIYWTQGYLDKRPYASAGILSFDGKGRVALEFTRSDQRKQSTTKGTYTVMENCSGSMHLETGTINQFYLAPNGSSFKWVRMTGEGAVGGQADRVTRGFIVK